MTLYDKIMQIYPDLQVLDFMPDGLVLLRNDWDGKGDYIAAWNHPTLAKPTDEQLAGIK